MQPMKLASSLIILLVWAFSAAAQELPAPPKKDVPYIIHATSLVEVEQNDAVPEEDKKQLIYYVPGASSGVTTPLGFPEFLFTPEQIDPRSLELYRFEPVNGRREILIRKKKKTVARPYFIDVFPHADGVMRIRVDGSLSPGEYCLTPNGSDKVFCFTVS